MSSRVRSRPYVAYDPAYQVRRYKPRSTLLQWLIAILVWLCIAAILLAIWYVFSPDPAMLTVEHIDWDNITELRNL